MDDGAVDEAHRDDAGRDHLVGAVERAADETLLFAVSPVRDDGPDVPRGDDAALAEPVDASAEFEGGSHGAGLGLPHAPETAQDLDLGRGPEVVHEGQDLLGEGDDILASRPRPDEGREKLGVGEGGRSLMDEAFAGLGAGSPLGAEPSRRRGGIVDRVHEPASLAAAATRARRPRA